jgi:ribonucleotide reductase alpha subunit
MKFTRVLTYDKPNDVRVEDWIRWRIVDAVITAPDGRVIFEQRGVEVPEQWSQNAANILAQKYFRKAGVPSAVSYHLGVPDMPEWLRPRVPVNSATFGGETSAKHVFHRMAGCWTYWGWREGLLTSEDDARVFYDEVFASLALQYAAPNSPQWFNTGIHWAYGIEGPDSGQWYAGDVSPYFEGTRLKMPRIEVKRIHNSYERPQPHACFIQTVEDDLVNPGGMMDLWTREARLFKHGSGSGSNMSKIRGRGEKLSGGGVSSGLMSFLRVGDRSAGSIKSGGTTRRAALMRVLDMDHPEIEDFIDWKATEEYKAACIAVGSRVIHDRLTSVARHRGDDRRVPRFDREADALGSWVPQSLVDRAKAGESDWPVHEADSFEGDAIETVSGQNSNNSVRVSNDFLHQVDNPDRLHSLTARTTGEVVRYVPVRGLWTRLCRAAWASGDPGVQFSDTINDWHTCRADGPINASNPCCFVGETFVDTSEGFISIEELARMSAVGEDLPWAFCFDQEDALPDLRPIARAWCSGYAHKLTEVTTRNGQVLYCTPEHGWLTRRAEGYVAARDLRVGTSLQKINREINTKRSDRVVLTHRSVGESSYGRSSQHKFVWEKMRGAVPSDYDVHHLNEDPTDDRFSNLGIKEFSLHQSEHSRGDRNPRFLDVDDETLVEVYDAAGRDPLSTRRRGKGIVTVGVWNKYVRKMGLFGVVPLGNLRDGGRIRGMSWDSFVERMEAARARVNDSVLSVKSIELDDPVPVYDIEVEGCHNFGVRSDATRNGDSIIVHNSEYLFLDDTACNLASIRLTKFLPLDDAAMSKFDHVVRLWTVVLEISVYMASFPSEAIARNSYLYRTLGLGYTDLGGLLMRQAIPYASDEGRAIAAGLTALMTGVAYRTSAEMAAEVGSFLRWEANAENMRRVLRNHRTALFTEKLFYAPMRIDPYRKPALQMESGLRDRCLAVWDLVVAAPAFRNAQVTLLAPTGTISFVMDCDTTGIEPDFALVKHKSLAGGGSMRIVNQAVEEGLRRKGRSESWISEALAEIEWTDKLKFTDSVEFACANDIAWEDHVKMVAVVQPFLSGGVSKTINMPRDATVDDVDRAYRLAHQLGVKTISIYRDGSKLSQPLSSRRDESTEQAERVAPRESIEYLERLPRGAREYLPWRREAGWTQKIKIGQDRQSVFLRVSEYPDGRPGEVFLEIAGEGSTLRALANCLAISISVGLQRGVPVAEYVDQLVGLKFEPAGYVEGHSRIRFASSIADYIGRELGISYAGRDDLANAPAPIAEAVERIAEHSERLDEEWRLSVKDNEQLVAHGNQTTTMSKYFEQTGDMCPGCGALLRRAGTCRSCPNCSWSEGCG